MERVKPAANHAASPFPYDLLLREDQLLQLRSMCGLRCDDKYPRRTEEERDASIICHVHHALRHYNANNPGSEFDPVKPLMAAYVGFRGSIWVHVSFLARKRNVGSSKRRRGKVDDPVKHFFAELCYNRHDCKSVVAICTIIDKTARLKTACAFCPESFEILHPLDGKFLVGKKSQAKYGLGFSHYMNLLEKPYTCRVGRSEAKDEGPPAPVEQDRRTLGWTLVPFAFVGNFVARFLWAFDARLKAWIAHLAS